MEVDLFAQGVKGHPDVLLCTLVQPQGIEPKAFNCFELIVVVVVFRAKMCYHYTNLAFQFVGRAISYYHIYGRPHNQF